MLNFVCESCSVDYETVKDYKKLYLIMWTNSTINSFVTQLLGNTSRLLLTSPLPWQQVNCTKRKSKFHFLQINSKTK